MMKQPQRLLLLIAAAVGIVAFFLPFIHFAEVLFIDIFYSGWNLVEAGLDAAEVGKFKKGRKLLNFLADQWKANKSLVDYIGFVGLVYIILGPFYFLIYAIRYLIAGLRNKSYHKGLIYFLIFSAFAWVGFYLGGQEYHIKINFLNRAGLGFWLTAISVSLGFVSRYVKKEIGKSGV